MVSSTRKRSSWARTNSTKKTPWVWNPLPGSRANPKELPSRTPFFPLPPSRKSTTKRSSTSASPSSPHSAVSSTSSERTGSTPWSSPAPWAQVLCTASSVRLNLREADQRFHVDRPSPSLYRNPLELDVLHPSNRRRDSLLHAG